MDPLSTIQVEAIAGKASTAISVDGGSPNDIVLTRRMVAVRGFLGLGDLVREVVGLREGRLVVRLRGVPVLAAGGGNAGDHLPEA